MEPRKVHVPVSEHTAEGKATQAVKRWTHRGPAQTDCRAAAAGPSGASWKLEQGCLFPFKSRRHVFSWLPVQSVASCQTRFPKTPVYRAKGKPLD